MIVEISSSSNRKYMFEIEREDLVCIYPVVGSVCYFVPDVGWEKCSSVNCPKSFRKREIHMCCVDVQNKNTCLYRVYEGLELI